MCALFYILTRSGIWYVFKFLDYQKMTGLCIDGVTEHLKIFLITKISLMCCLTIFSEIWQIFWTSSDGYIKPLLFLIETRISCWFFLSKNFKHVSHTLRFMIFLLQLNQLCILLSCPHCGSHGMVNKWIFEHIFHYCISMRLFFSV